MYYIIMNPSSKSGKGLSSWQKLEPIFQERKIPYKLMLSSHAGNISELTEKITSDAVNTDSVINLIILGGDGTINEALQGIRDFSRVRIGYIPTGSSNDLARDLHLDKNPMAVLEKILREKPCAKYDLGCLRYEETSNTIKRRPDTRLPHTCYFLVSSGIGFDAAVCEEALSSNIKNTLNKLRLGKLTYLGIALKQILTAKPVSCELSLDGEPAIHIKHFLFIASMIHRYEGGGFKFCPDADAQDGLLDLCVVGRMPKLLILTALPTAFFGKHYIFPQISHYRAKRVEIRTSKPLWVHTDGEVPFRSDHIFLSCEAGKAAFLN